MGVFMPRIPLPKISLPNPKAALSKLKKANKPRAKRESDEAYNARRRLKRQSERYMKEAEKHEGTTYGKRMKALAKESLDLAAQTYIDKTTRTYSETAKNVIASSYKALASEAMDEERQADIIMSSKIGARIYAGSIEVWEGKSYDEREQALWDAFGVKSNAQLLELLERQFGKSLYNMEQPENYDTITTSIANLLA